MMTKLFRAGLLALGGAALACVPALMNPQRAQADAMANAHAQIDGQMAQHLESMRSRATAPGAAFTDLENWAGTLEGVWDSGTVERGGVDGPGHAEAILAQLAAHQAPGVADATIRGRALAWKGRLLLRLERPDEGLTALNASLDAGPTTLAAVPLVEHLGRGGRHGEVAAACKKARPGMKTDPERALLLDRCVRHSGEQDVQRALGWASKEDVAFFEQQRAAAAQRQADRDQAQKDRADQMREEGRARDEASRAERERQAAAMATAPAPSAPHTGRVEIVSECSRSVRLFIGETPKFGSGRYTSWGGNTRGSEHVKSMIWLVDDKQNGLSSASVGPGTKQVLIHRSCTGLSAR